MGNAYGAQKGQILGVGYPSSTQQSSTGQTHADTQAHHPRAVANVSLTWSKGGPKAHWIWASLTENHLNTSLMENQSYGIITEHQAPR